MILGTSTIPSNILFASAKITIDHSTFVLQRFFKGSQWLALSEVNEEMAATWAAPALKKRKERKKREDLEERISKLEEEVENLKKQLELKD
jgi:hypothetical protein